MELTRETAAFMIISKGGTASSLCLKAFSEAKEGNIAYARELCEEASESLNEAHRIQTNLIQEEAKGNSVGVDILMVHAQDHLMNAMLIQELSTHIIQLYENTGCEKNNGEL